MQLTGTGVWSSALVSGDQAYVVDAAAELEELGYTSLWVPTFGPGAFEVIERLLGGTQTTLVATGILNVWMYGAGETAEAFARIADAHGERFLLGLGVSHGPVVDRFVPGATYAKPLRTMTSYLAELDSAIRPVPVERRVLAALGPKMLDLARTSAGGAHPYNVTPNHTLVARHALGPGKLLVPEQAVAMTSAADEARRWGRSFLENYLGLPNYANSLRRQGFTDDDLEHGGSNRLVDALVAWGDDATIAARVREHRDAGADSVCIQVLQEGPMGGIASLPIDVYRELASALC
jgi:probable F420-dependent oxidoreductase